MQKTLLRLQHELGTLSAEYADLRLVEVERVRIRTKKGTLEEQKKTLSRGVGFRVLKQGAFGFSATGDLGEKSLRFHLRQAEKMAREFSKIRHSEIKFTPAKPVKERWKMPVAKDPWALSLKEQIGPLHEAETRILREPQLDSTSGFLDFTRKQIVFISSEGSWIEQTLYRTGGWIYGETWQGREKIRRSWPGPSGCYRAQGYEAIEGFNFYSEAERLAEELKELRQSPEGPAGEFTLILKGSALALQLHETFGHASESDRVYGYEDNFGGRTFLNPGLLGGFPVASPEVNLVSDSRFAAGGPGADAPGLQNGSKTGSFVAGGFGAGSFHYDDEGMPARKTEILRQGIFSGYQTSRETSFFLNQSASNAHMVAEDWSHYPLIRMTNFSLLPGKSSLEEMISETGAGYLLDNELSWSIDEMRLDFQIGAEAGYHIQNGKVRGLVRFPVYHGNTIDFWKNCDRVGSEKEWQFWGFPDCGKGGPYQEAFTGHGLSPARFQKVRFGRD